MGLTPDVSYGQIINSTIYGNEIRDRSNQMFDDIAQRDAQWPDGTTAASAPEGAQCRTVADNGWWVIRNNTWTPVSTIGLQLRLIGWFGESKNVSDLPVDGFLPQDWDAPGRPLADFQCVPGDGLFFDPIGTPTHPQLGHLFQFVDTLNPTGWVDLGYIRGPAGPQGPIGPPGLTGPAGVDGADGVDGVDGRTILSGVTNPTTQGAEGDYWIDYVAWNVFGPKDVIGGTNWPPGVSMIGPKGDSGDATIIVGEYGQMNDPTDLPVTGLIPQDWDGPGRPAVGYQMLIGQSLIYHPLNVNDALYGTLWTYVSAATVPAGWINSGRIIGPEGPPGEDGTATIIVGEFGATRVVADLPLDGIIPEDWDSPGNPSRTVQFVVGESLIFVPVDTTDPDWGHVFQYVTDLYEPTGWLDLGQIRFPSSGNPGQLELWDPTVNYVIGDRVGWPVPPNTLGWQATADNINQEPGVAVGSTDTVGWDFPGGLISAGQQGLRCDVLVPALAAGDNGYDLRIHTHGALDPTDGAVLVGFDLDAVATQGFALRVSGTDLHWHMPGNTGWAGLRVPIGSLDLLHRPWIRITQYGDNNVGPQPDNQPAQFWESIDGVTWTPLTAETPMAGFGGFISATRFAIGTRYQTPGTDSNYGGVIRSVELRHYQNQAMLVSWDARTQPGDDGTGVSPVTGHNFTRLGTGVMDPVDETTLPPWLLISDVVHRSGDTMYGDLSLLPGDLTVDGWVEVKGTKAHIDLRQQVHGTTQNTGPLNFMPANSNQRLGDIHGNWVSTNGDPEAEMRFYVECGNWSYQRGMTLRWGSPPNLFVNGDVYARGVMLTSTTDVKEDVTDLDLLAAHQDFQALRPIQFRFLRPYQDRGIGPQVQLRWGLAAESAPAILQSEGDEGLALDVGGLIGALVAEGQYLGTKAASAEAFVAELQDRAAALTEELTESRAVETLLQGQVSGLMGLINTMRDAHDALRARVDALENP